MVFPWLDLRLAGFPVAIIVKPGGEIDFHRIKVVNDGYFFVKFNKISGGVFKIDNKYRYRGRKAAIYLYDASQGKPLSIPMLKELAHFARKNSLHRIKRKDVTFAEKIRIRLSMKKDVEKNEILKEITEEASQNKQEIEQQLASYGENDNVTPYQIIQDLYSAGKIEKETAMNLSQKLESGKLDFPQFLDELSEINDVKVHEPISADAQLFLEDFSNYNPSEVYQSIVLSRNAGKEFEKMASQPVNNGQLAKIIIPLGLIMIVGFYIMSQMDFSNLGDIGDMLPSPPSWIVPRE